MIATRRLLLWVAALSQADIRGYPPLSHAEFLPPLVECRRMEAAYGRLVDILHYGVSSRPDLQWEMLCDAQHEFNAWKYAARARDKDYTVGQRRDSLNDLRDLLKERYLTEWWLPDQFTR